MKFLIIRACKLLNVEYDQDLIDEITSQVTNDITNDERYNQTISNCSDDQVQNLVTMRIRNLKIEHIVSYLTQKLSKRDKYKQYRFLANLQIIQPTSDNYVELVELPNGEFMAKYNYESAYKTYDSFEQAYDDQFREGSYNIKKMERALSMMSQPRFTALLNAKNLSGIQFSKISGLQQSVITRLTSGDSKTDNMTFISAGRIARGFEITLDDLYRLMTE